MVDVFRVSESVKLMVLDSRSRGQTPALFGMSPYICQRLSVMEG